MCETKDLISSLPSSQQQYEDTQSLEISHDKDSVTRTNTPPIRSRLRKSRGDNDQKSLFWPSTRQKWGWMGGRTHLRKNIHSLTMDRVELLCKRLKLGSPYQTKPYPTIPYHPIPYHTLPYYTVSYTLPIKTRPYTRLPLSRAGGQEQCWRKSLGHPGRSRMLKKLKNAKKVKRGPTNWPTDQLTNQPTDRPTDRRTDIAGCRVA